MTATLVCGLNRKVTDKAVGVEIQRPYDILLKYKALQRGKDDQKKDKETGRTSEKPERPVLSGFLNEVRTYFESKYRS